MADGWHVTFGLWCRHKLVSQFPADVIQEIVGKRTQVVAGLPGMRSKGRLIAHTLAHFSRSLDCTGTVKYNTMIKS